MTERHSGDETEQSLSSQPKVRVEQKFDGDGYQGIGSMDGESRAIRADQYVENLHQVMPEQPRQQSLFQLPPDISEFTGREDEVAQIEACLGAGAETTAVVISAIAGMGGVGKSALAVHVAHLLKPQFPDGQLYVNLRGADDAPLAAVDVLGTWLREFGIDEGQIPQDELGRARMYRAWLGEKRVLVLLDNASDEAQVKPLLPGGAGCGVMVTSRRKLVTLAGAEGVDLSQLSEDEALELLGKLAGEARLQAEPEEAKRLVELCGYLPLAIRVAGSLLRRKGHWSLGKYCQDLADERARLAKLTLEDLDVAASLQLSYRELGEADAELFAGMGVMLGAFPVGAAGALLAEGEDAEASLERLVDGQLLEALGERRYRYHDLVRLFARQQLGEGVEATAKGKLADWYWQGASLFASALNPRRRRQVAEQLGRDEGEFMDRALAWFELERQNLLTALNWLSEAEEDKQAISLVGNLARFFSIHSHWQDSVMAHQVALGAAKRSNNQAGAAQTLNNLGMIYRSQGHWEDAIECYEQSLEVQRELGGRDGVAQTLNNLGVVYQSQGRWEDAIDCYEQSLEVKRELGDRHGVAQTLANMGMLWKAQNQPDKAKELLRESLTQLHLDSPDTKLVQQWLQHLSIS